MKIKLGVIFGGKSVEHEISVITALQAMNHIDTDKYEIVPIYITKDLQMYTGGMLRYIDSYKDFRLIHRYAKRVNLVNIKGRFILQTTGLFKREYNEIHMAIPMVHGAKAEDGTVQGFLELLGIPCAGSNIYASVVGQDKVFMKQILASEDVPLTKYIWFFDTDYYNDEEALFKKISSLSYPLIIKPATLGSSVGIEVIRRKEELESAIEKAIKYDNKIIIEEYIENIEEFTCSVLGNSSKVQTSDIEKIVKTDGIKKYADKVIKQKDIEDNTNLYRELPAEISQKLTKEIEDLSKQVFRLLNHRGVATIDFLYDTKSKKIYVDEINTIPNFFSHHLWEGQNVSYREILNYILNDTVKEIHKQEDMTLTLETGILKDMLTKDIEEMK